MIKKIILCVLTALLANGVGMAQSKKHSLPKEKDMGAYLMVYHKDCDPAGTLRRLPLALPPGFRLEVRNRTP